MAEAYSIWTPVIIGKLASSHRIKAEQTYNIDKVFKAIEDLKIRVRGYHFIPQGRLVELQLKLDILCLLEDFLGSMHLLVKEEVVKEKIKLNEFDAYIDHNMDIKYILNNLESNAHGELRAQILQVAYFIDVTIIATNEQIISLTTADEIGPEEDILHDVLQKLRLQVEKMENEKRALKRQIFFYERDISSLKRGIVKAENKNAQLNRELQKLQDLLEEQEKALKEKEDRLRHHGRYDYRDRAKSTIQEEVSPLGSRIKRMFLQA